MLDDTVALELVFVGSWILQSFVGCDAHSPAPSNLGHTHEIALSAPYTRLAIPTSRRSACMSRPSLSRTCAHRLESNVEDVRQDK
jgi:hypothetical protein